VRGEAFTGRAEEATWDQASRDLRFFGDGHQEIEILRDDFHGPVKAREIVYSEERNQVILRGEVSGEIVQSSFPTDITREAPRARVEPAAQGEGPSPSPVAWAFDTSELVLQMAGTAGDLRLESLAAKDKVLLRNEALGIQLRGDDLTYDEGTRKIHIFSRDGRPQTLVCSRLSGLTGVRPPDRTSGEAPSDEPRSDPSMDQSHKIGSQEIWILLYENPPGAGRRGAGTGWLLVEFSKDVMASFYLPAEGARTQKVRSLDMGDTWKMVAERLTLHIDPSQPPGAAEGQRLRNLIPWAVATGRVVFSAGSYQATADRAIYEDPLRRLTLIGSPARLSQENRTVEESPEILIRKVEGVIEYSPAGRTPRTQVPEIPSLPR
jgi:hypothetical protein